MRQQREIFSFKVLKYSIISSVLLAQNRACLSSYGIHGLLVCTVNKMELSQNSLDSAKLLDDFFFLTFVALGAVFVSV